MYCVVIHLYLLLLINLNSNALYIFHFPFFPSIWYVQAGITAAPARAVSAVKNMNIPQQIKDMKLPDLPQAIKDLKF